MQASMYHSGRNLSARVLRHRGKCPLGPGILPHALPRCARCGVARITPVTWPMTDGTFRPKAVVHPQEFRMPVFVRVVTRSALELPGIVQARRARQRHRIGKLPSSQRQSAVVDERNRMPARRRRRPGRWRLRPPPARALAGFGRGPQNHYPHLFE